MEKGKLYEVYYKDDTQTRHKTLKFKEKDHNFLYFSNEFKEKTEEIIPISSIIRISRNKENEKAKSSIPPG